MEEIDYALQVDDLFELHRQIAAEFDDMSPEPRAGCAEALHACVGRAESCVVYGDGRNIPCVVRAAALLHGIATRHAFVDGNKRLAWRAACITMERSGYRIAVHERTAADYVLFVVDKKPDVETIVDHLVRWVE